MRRPRLLNNSGLVALAGMTHDLLIAAISHFLAYVTILGVAGTLATPGIWQNVGAFTAASGIGYLVFALHRGSWRYVSIPDLITIFKAGVFAVVMYTVAVFLLTRGINVPRSVLVLSGLYLTAGLIGPRLAYRLSLERRLLLPISLQRKQSEQRHVLLYGLTDSAESFIRLVNRGIQSNVNIVGILDDSPHRQAKSVQGVKVLGSLADLDSIMARSERKGVKISEIIVTQTAPSKQMLGEIVEKAAGLGITSSRTARLTETEQLTSRGLMEPKQIELGDLLGRPEVVTDMRGVAGLITDRVVLVTGAGGSIGSELCRQIAQFNPRKLVVTDSSEFHLYTLDTELRDDNSKLPIEARLLDVRDRARVNRIMYSYRPEIVFHAAALKHVPLVEDNPLEGIKTNLLGTRNVADAALASGCTIYVMISTDKAVNPTNIMGATKRAAEAYCQALDVSSKKTRFKTVRFGNVLGSNGSVVPRFREQIANGGPVTVTHPQIVRFFMTIPEAVRLVLHASGHAIRNQAERGKIMVLDMGEPVRIVHLAERMIQLAGLKPHADIAIEFTGLRPGEKLYEELFDPSEIQDEKTRDGFVFAAPRVMDGKVLNKTISEIETAVGQEDQARAVGLLSHIVPEYRREAGPPVSPPDHAQAPARNRPASASTGSTDG